MQTVPEVRQQVPTFVDNFWYDCLFLQKRNLFYTLKLQ